VDDAQRALDRAAADRERARQKWERDVADAEQALAQAQRALTTARLQYSDTAVEEARVNLRWAQKSESDRKAEYEQAQTMWPPIPVDAFRDSWQRAIDERRLAEMRLADAEAEHRVAALDLETREEDVAEAEQALAALQEGLDAQYGRAVEDAQDELTQAQDLAHARLTAPWTAIVLSVDVAPGATVGAGTPVVTLLDVGDGLRFVTQNLSEQHIAAIYPGQRAVVTLRTFAETPLEGTVEAVVPQENEAADTDARFTVRIRLSSSAGLRLLPGLTGRVEIYTGE
jgi:multidrug resistance efflux pump